MMVFARVKKRRLGGKWGKWILGKIYKTNRRDQFYLHTNYELKWWERTGDARSG